MKWCFWGGWIRFNFTKKWKFLLRSIIMAENYNMYWRNFQWNRFACFGSEGLYFLLWGFFGKCWSCGSLDLNDKRFKFDCLANILYWWYFRWYMRICIFEMEIWIHQRNMHPTVLSQSTSKHNWAQKIYNKPHTKLIYFINALKSS